MAKIKYSAEDVANLLSLINIFGILFKAIAKELDKLKDGKIKPEEVDVKKWIDILEGKEDLPEN